jgi:hypothetical protein
MDQHDPKFRRGAEAAAYAAIVSWAEDQPNYWMWETSGVLQSAVVAYLEGGELGTEHIAALRAYLRQWVMAPVWDRNPHAGDEEHRWLAGMRQAIDGLTTRAAIARWLHQAEEQGLDPL